MKHYRTAASALATLILIAACTHSDVRQHAAVDADAKSIAIPPHKGGGLLKGVAETLARAGWKVSVDQTAAARGPKAAARAKSAKRGKTSATDKAKEPASGEAKKRKKDDTEERKAERERGPPEPASGEAPKTRYRLTASFRSIEFCRSGGRLFIYELAIVDTQDGGKVLEQSGRDCERDILEKFGEALQAGPR